MNTTARTRRGLEWLDGRLPEGLAVHVETTFGYGLDDDGALVVQVHPRTAEQLREAIRVVGRVDKKQSGTGLRLTAEPHPDVIVLIHPPAGTCERVQVGTEKVVKREPVGEVEYREVEVEEPVYRWECPESVLDAVRADAEVVA